MATVILGVFATPALPEDEDSVAALPPDDEHAARAKAAVRVAATVAALFERFIEDAFRTSPPLRDGVLWADGRSSRAASPRCPGPLRGADPSPQYDVTT
jgi:hypothetical protein